MYVYTYVYVQRREHICLVQHTISIDRLENTEKIAEESCTASAGAAIDALLQSLCLPLVDGAQLQRGEHLVEGQLGAG